MRIKFGSHHKEIIKMQTNALEMEIVDSNKKTNHFV